MPSTLSHRPFLRFRPSARRRLALLVVLAAGASCTGWTAPGSPAARDELELLEPAPAGTYRLVGTEQDSRTGRLADVVEIYVVEPAFDRSGTQRQLTSLEDGSGAKRGWETEFREAGAFRLREMAEAASWDWIPPLRTLAAPLRAGTSWTSASTATVPDLAGVRRTMAVEGRSEVMGTATVTIAGVRIHAFVVEATVTTTITDILRTTREETTTVTVSTGRTWYAPSRRLAVRTEVRTQVTGGPAGSYTVIRRLAADRF